jgi:hypothetical protein
VGDDRRRRDPGLTRATPQRRGEVLAPPHPGAGGQHVSAAGIRRTVACGPWPGGPRGCRDRPGYACAAGSRASSHDGGCSAERCACSLEGSRLNDYRRRKDRTNHGPAACSLDTASGRHGEPSRAGMRQHRRCSTTLHGTARSEGGSNGHWPRCRRADRSAHQGPGCGQALDAATRGCVASRAAEPSPQQERHPRARPRSVASAVVRSRPAVRPQPVDKCVEDRSRRGTAALRHVRRTSHATARRRERRRR